MSEHCHIEHLRAPLLMGTLLACLLLGCLGAAGAGAVPLHTETWAYVDQCHGQGSTAPSLVREWITYAEAGCPGPGGSLANTDCRVGGTAYCSTFAYLDPNLIWGNGGLPIPQTAPQSWWVHQSGYSDAAHRLVWYDAHYGSGHLLNPATPQVQSWVSQYASSQLSGFGGLVLDDTAASVNQQLYGSGNPAYRTSREFPAGDDFGVQQAHVQMAAAISPSFAQVDNTMDVNPYVVPPFPLLDHPASVSGLMSEDFPWQGSRMADFYSTGLDDMAYLTTTPRLAGDFLVLLGYDSNGALSARRVQEATVMLGYQPRQIVDWADLQRADGFSSDLTAWPEEGLYPTQPVQTMSAPTGVGCVNGGGGPCTGGANSLRVANGSDPSSPWDPAAGVFRREFRGCYYRGTWIGACAAIVNDTDLPVTVSASWLTQRYSYQMTMLPGSSGAGDVQAGGTLNLRGASFTPGFTTIAPNDAILLAGNLAARSTVSNQSVSGESPAGPPPGTCAEPSGPVRSRPAWAGPLGLQEFSASDFHPWLYNAGSGTCDASPAGGSAAVWVDSAAAPAQNSGTNGYITTTAPITLSAQVRISPQTALRRIRQAIDSR